MKRYLAAIIYIFLSIPAFSSVPIVPEEYIVLEKANTGYDLYIKKIDGIESILLTDAQKDPALKKTTDGLRPWHFYYSNRNEIRLLNGKILHTKYDLHFLVDSTTEPHGKLGECFHFYLPEKVLYGYDWTEKGELKIEPGARINLRLFSKKYADYTGEFRDQWIILKLAIDESKFTKNLIENVTELSDAGSGKVIIKPDEDLGDFFLKNIPPNVPASSDCDVVFIVDCTLSMRDDMPVFKKVYPAIKQALLD